MGSWRVPYQISDLEMEPQLLCEEQIKGRIEKKKKLRLKNQVGGFSISPVQNDDGQL